MVLTLLCELEEAGQYTRLDLVQQEKDQIQSWHVQGLIERAGFNIEKSNTEDSLASEYFCRKIKSL